MPVVNDGVRITINLTGAGVTFFEKEVTPPGIDGGEAVPTSTLRNVLWNTFAPRKFLTLTPITVKVAYDPQLYTTILAQLNLNQQVVMVFPKVGTYAGIQTGGSLTVWMYLKSFMPDAYVEGKQPEATITFHPTNMDTNGVEQAPFWTP